MNDGATITPTTLAADDNLAAAALQRPRAVKAHTAGGASTLTIAAVVGAVGLLGATGWFMTRDNDGIPELAADSTVAVVAATPIQPAPPVTVAAETTAPAAIATPARRVAVAPRVRPAASAAETGVNASATLPAAPQAYSTLNPSVAPQPVIAEPPVVVEAAPAVPESIPQTAPITPTPDTTTPPT